MHPNVRRAIVGACVVGVAGVFALVTIGLFLSIGPKFNEMDRELAATSELR